MQVGKRIETYVKGTKGFGIMYIASEEFELVSYIDNEGARSIDDRKSTYRYVFYMGSGAISWASKKKPIVAQSTIEAEYIATNATHMSSYLAKKNLSRFE